MPLPKITIPVPAVIAPVAPKTYADGYIVGMALATRDVAGTDQSLTLTLRPYDQDTAALYPTDRRDQVHTITSIWNEAARSNLFAQVLGGIVTVTGLLVQERDLLSRIGNAALVEPPLTAEEVAALESQLVEVRTALGVA